MSCQCSPLRGKNAGALGWFPPGPALAAARARPHIAVSWPTRTSAPKTSTPASARATSTRCARPPSPRCSCAFATSAGRRGSGSARLTRRGVGSAHFARFEPLPGQLPASRWRCATTAISSASTTRTSATAAAFSSRSRATIARAPARSRHQGLRARRRWSRGGDGRLTLKGGVREVLATEMLEALGVYTSKTLLALRDRRGAHRGDEPSPTRSSVLVRPQPHPRPLRQLPAPRRPRRDRRARAGWSTTPSRTTGPSCRARSGRPASPPSATASSAPSRGSAPSGWPPASCTACSTPTT